MEKDSRELENLKQKLFSNKTTEDDQIFIFRQVMKEVGGYEQFMNLTIPAFQVIAESIILEKKNARKAYEKAKSHSRLK